VQAPYGWRKNVVVREGGGRNLKTELERLKKRARTVFSGSSGSSSGSRQTPPVPEATSPDRDPERVQAHITVDTTVIDDKIFLQPDPGPIEILVPGEEVLSEQGPFYRIREGVSSIWEKADAAYSSYLDAIASPPLKMPRGCRPLGRLAEGGAEAVVYLDLETTGLRNSPLFLIGLMYSEGGNLIIDQLFARDYTEERSVLSFVSGILGSRSVMVTFNGNTFDIPFLADRMTYHTLQMSLPRHHVDLLPISRRLMRGMTPDNRLQTLERFVLGRKRTGDIAGSEIPGAYHEFVRTKDARQMAAVIYHNRLDLLSMLELVTVYISHI
jgi:uncharacterized protein YprB with RNaseH-like and TPR domain